MPADSLGSMKPTSVTASVASTIQMMSPFDMQFFMNIKRSGMPSFFMGRGR